jgi:hypothetical protein
LTGEISWTPDRAGTYEILLAAYKGVFGLSFHQIRVGVSAKPMPWIPLLLLGD